MTQPATHSDVLSPSLTPPLGPDSPSVRVAARARVTTTQRNPARGKRRVWTAVRTAAAGWWVWTSRPASLRTMWRLSAVTWARVPLRSGPLLLVWRVSNWTDRLAMFALVLLAPTCLTGPLRWLSTRPTRRFAFYLLGAITAAVVLL
jgi:hypothetical protein